MKTNEELKQTGFLKFESLMEDGGKCVLFIPALQQVQGAYNVPSSEEYLLLCYVYGITE